MMDDHSISCENNASEALKSYRTGRFIASLVFLVLSIAVVCVGIGVVSAILPSAPEINDGVAAFGFVLLMYLWVFVIIVSLVFALVFSLVGLVCGISSLKALPSNAIKVIAVISTVLNGIIMTASFIPVILIVVVLIMYF